MYLHNKRLQPYIIPLIFKPSLKFFGLGLPYKAKTWELKLRLAECEEWFQQSRQKVTELEETIENNSSELENLRDIKKQFEDERARANQLQHQLQ